MLLAHTHENVSKLRAVTVERGATPAEAATAALLARRLSSRIAQWGDCDIARRTTRLYPLAPGVHVDII
jgi:hypothetical protein